MSDNPRQPANASPERPGDNHRVPGFASNPPSGPENPAPSFPGSAGEGGPVSAGFSNLARSLGNAVEGQRPNETLPMRHRPSGDEIAKAFSSESEPESQPAGPNQTAPSMDAASFDDFDQAFAAVDPTEGFAEVGPDEEEFAEVGPDQDDHGGDERPIVQGGPAPGPISAGFSNLSRSLGNAVEGQRPNETLPMRHRPSGDEIAKAFSGAGENPGGGAPDKPTAAKGPLGSGGTAPSINALSPEELDDVFAEQAGGKRPETAGPSFGAPKASGGGEEHAKKKWGFSSMKLEAVEVDEEAAVAETLAALSGGRTLARDEDLDEDEGGGAKPKNPRVIKRRDLPAGGPVEMYEAPSPALAEPEPEPANVFPQIEGYQIVKPVGQGDSGTVYQGLHVATNRPVAIKAFVFEGASEKRGLFRQRFHMDACQLSKSSSDRVVKYHGIYPDSKNNEYLVMDFAEGRPLSAALLQDDQVEIAQAVQGCMAAALALQDAHAVGVVHRDLRPKNIIFDHEGKARISGFGIAGNHNAEVTETKAKMSSPFYLSPEMFHDDGLAKADPRSDIYSLSVILYHMVCGRVPFRTYNPFRLSQQIFNEEPPPPRESRPDIPEALEALILKGMAKKPEDRFQSASEMLLALERIMERLVEARNAQASAKLAMVEQGGKGAKIVLALVAVGVVVVAATVLAIALGWFNPKSQPLPTGPEIQFSASSGQKQERPKVTFDDVQTLYQNALYPAALNGVQHLDQSDPAVRDLKAKIEAAIAKPQ